MSAFAMANAGSVPTSGWNISPKDLYAAAGALPGQVEGIKISRVKVEIFDLSDKKQRKAYEKLWARLLVKVSKMEAVVESSKDLVRRSDGTSYWMKYVEYVEFDINKNKERP